MLWTGRVRTAAALPLLLAGLLAAACSGGAAGAPRNAAPATTAASATGAAPARTGAPVSGARLHYVSNTGTDRADPAALGFNLFDMGPAQAAIDALGPGQQALVWLGRLDNTNCTPGMTWAEFTAAVDRLAGDPKVFGYYLSDEPHPDICPTAVADIRARADYVRSRDPRQKSFIVVLGSCPRGKTCEDELLKPVNTHVDLYGVDIFPCNAKSGCQLGKIDTRVAGARRDGVPDAALVPVYQAFGQMCNTEQAHYYIVPSQEQMRAQLSRWSQLIPHPVFDFAYTWRSEGPACPALDRANGQGGITDLQAVVRRYNGH